MGALEGDIWIWFGRAQTCWEECSSSMVHDFGDKVYAEVKTDAVVLDQFVFWQVIPNDAYPP